MKTEPTVPLIKLLTEAGAGSRRKMADAIRNGRVTVNGQVAESFNHPVNSSHDRVQIDGTPVTLSVENPICLMLNKPKDILSTTFDERGGRTVLDILPEKYRRYRLYPVGRLDKDTTGLLLVTNDGELTNRLTHPRYEHEKEYLVQIEGKLTVVEKQQLEGGIRLDEGMTSPARVKEVTARPFNYSLTIHEGRKRQVRRMFARLGYRILALKRVRTGNLALGDLKEGQVRELTAREIARLLER
ncbi:MAG: pseudouridine synthase [Dehalococcoidia bacterium]|nr:pseudouridine synthase [Dehalococcoidia bacterium]